MVDTAQKRRPKDGGSGPPSTYPHTPTGTTVGGKDASPSYKLSVSHEDLRYRRRDISACGTILQFALLMSCPACRALNEPELPPQDAIVRAEYIATPGRSL